MFINNENSVMNAYYKMKNGEKRVSFIGKSREQILSITIDHDNEYLVNIKIPFKEEIIEKREFSYLKDAVRYIYTRLENGQ